MGERGERGDGRGVERSVRAEGRVRRGEDALGAPFAMFDFAPVGAVTAVAGLLFVALVGWRLIPQREDAVLEASEIADYIAELTVPEGSDLIGKRLIELEDTAIFVFCESNSPARQFWRLQGPCQGPLSRPAWRLGGGGSTSYLATVRTSAQVLYRLACLCVIYVPEQRDYIFKLQL